MKATGIVRKIDDLGRFTIPMETRKNFDLIEGETTLEMYIGEEQEMVLKKYEPGCIFCGEADEVTTFKGKLVCQECNDGIKTDGRQEKNERD